MRFAKYAVALCATVGTVAVFSAPASAADPCVSDPSLPTCVNDAIDKAEAVLVLAHSDPCVAQANIPACVDDVGSRTLGGLETARAIYNNTIRPLGDAPACLVYEKLTGKPCPGFLPVL